MCSSDLVIDHHPVKNPEKLPALHEVRSSYGACATVVWQMLLQAGYDVNRNRKLSTALYYGLYMDTGRLQEISHPMDKNMREALKIDESAFTLFRNSNLSLDELKIVSRALERVDYREAYRYAIVESEPCDPNILGIISDTLLEVDIIDTCIVYSVLSGRVKLSIRSCTKETRANELGEAAAEGLGAAGGHHFKSGGFLDEDHLAEAYAKEHNGEKPPVLGDWVHEVLNRRMEAYFRDQEIIRTDSCEVALSDMQLYRKNRVSIGYVKAEEVFAAGTDVRIRMLEGDVDITICEGIWIMIGIDHEIYPSRREYVREKYDLTEDTYLFEGEYSPTVHNKLTGEQMPLIPHARCCAAKETSYVYARELSCRTKVFTEWDKEQYMLGLPGDYLAVSKENPKDMYIVKRKVFERLYTKE